MDKREKLIRKIQAVREKQELLAEKEFELCKKCIQISDKKQWYEEKERTVGLGFTWIDDGKIEIKSFNFVLDATK